MSLADTSLILFNTLQACEGIPCTIARAGQSCAPTVVLGRSDSEALTNREATYADDTQDVLVAASDYKPTGTLSAPKDGDVITYSEQGKTVTAEARPSGDSQQCFRNWRGGAVYRVHTKIVSRS